MSKKLKASENTAKDIETPPNRKDLAAELGEITLQRAKLAAALNQLDLKCRQIAVEIEGL